MSDDSDRDELVIAAKRAQENAYAPYSKFRVGAALRFADGTIVTGANVENASYGLSLCAEAMAVAKAMNEGHRGGLEAVAVIGSDGDIQPDLLSVNLVGRDRDAFLYNVRFETRERVKGGDVTNRWAANVRMKRVDMAATNRVRIFNPFTFQVIEYRKVPESMPTGLPR